MSNLVTRALAGSVYVALILASIHFGPFWFALLFFLLALVGYVEYVSMGDLTPKTADLLTGLSAGFVLFVSLFLLFYNRFQFINILVSLALFAFLLPAISKLFSNSDYSVNRLVGGLAYTFLPFALMLYLFYADHPTRFHNPNSNYLYALFLSTWLNDTFAYLVGRSFGKTKLAHKISPKKTWEGFIGGGFVTLIVAYFLFPWLLELSLVDSLVIAAISFIIGTLGDLLESMFKRKANIKDSGSLIPGHGGVLDRLDSIILSGPAVFLYLAVAKSLLR